MVDISWPTSSSPGKHPAESEGRLINMFAYREDEEIRRKRTPGLRVFCDTGLTGPRGFHEVNGLLYGAFKDKAVTISAAGVKTELLGTFSGSKPVTWARNNKATTPDIAAVSENGAFLISGGSIVPYSTVEGNVGSPNSVCSIDGYLVFSYGDGTLRATGLNVTSINALSSAKAESNPDGLMRVAASGGLLYAFGAASIEAWQDVGTSPFPFRRVDAVAVGLKGSWAVAGFGDGWDRPFLFVASDNTVRQMNGITPQPVSTPAVERAISKVKDPTTLEACVYTFGGNAIWSLSGPGFTWEYNVTTGKWHERQSYGSSRWRGSKTIMAYGRWLIGDTASTNLLEIAEDAMTEAGDPLRARIESKRAKSFPARVACGRADFEVICGVGNDMESDPEMEISWSDDGGSNWAVPLRRSLGPAGKPDVMVTVLATGQTSHLGRVWRLDVSDPVDFTLLGGTMQAKARAI